MGNESNAKALGTSATTTFGSVLLMGITIGATLTGTVTIKEGTNTVLVLAIGTPAGDYCNVPNGVRYSALSIVLSAGDAAAAFSKIA